MTRSLGKVSIADARPAVEAALKEQGFGVLTEIDVKATLKKKIGADTEPYLILGACNPQLAHQALDFEPGIGLLLPCNVVLATKGDETIVSFADPLALFSIVGKPDLEPIAKQVRERLVTAMESIKV
ncbi:MAG: DUF302 domain-containing protein [Myxococcales bacterium]|nr:DUF302 domain-containing protein [Myxococcales bacterium]